MDPATPDWHAFGQPVAATTADPAQPDGRLSWSERLARVPRSTLVALGVAALMAVAGLGLALATPSGGDVAFVAADDAALDRLPAGAARSLADGLAVPITGELVVDVAGAVVRPGVVRLTAGSRIGDAITAAGGYASTVDLDAVTATLNLAAPLADGLKVLVPELGAMPAGGDAGVGEGGSGAGAGGGLLDLNAATQSDLEALPGIGPVTAGRILEARGEAPFGSVNELRSRGLVGESTFGKLRDLVTVGR